MADRTSLVGNYINVRKITGRVMDISWNEPWTRFRNRYVTLGYLPAAIGYPDHVIQSGGVYFCSTLGIMIDNKTCANKDQ